MGLDDCGIRHINSTLHNRCYSNYQPFKFLEGAHRTLLVTNDAERIGRAREFDSDRNALARRGLQELR